MKCSRRGDDCIEILGEHDRVNGCSVISLQKNEQSPLGCFGYLHRKNRLYINLIHFLMTGRQHDCLKQVDN